MSWPAGSAAPSWKRWKAPTFAFTASASRINSSSTGHRTCCGIRSAFRPKRSRNPPLSSSNTSGLPSKPSANPLGAKEVEPKYVSRGGHKLRGAIDHFKIKVKDRVCLDVGSSTGGFTDCLLQAGAKSVWAVDVGYGLF